MPFLPVTFSISVQRKDRQEKIDRLPLLPKQKLQTFYKIIKHFE